MSGESWEEFGGEDRENEFDDYFDFGVTPPYNMESEQQEPMKLGSIHSDYKNSNSSDTLSPPVASSCVVCDDQSDGLHFGQLTCRACAAFFRRTVSLKLDYTCRSSGRCDINKSARNMCRSCRYQKCLSKGMLISAVQQARDSLGKRKERHAHHERNSKSTSPKSTIEQPMSTVTQAQTPATQIIHTSSPGTEYSTITPDHLYWNNQVVTNGVIGIAATPAPNYINQFSTMQLNQLNQFVAPPPREEMQILPKIKDGFDQFKTLMQASMDFVREQREAGCPTFPTQEIVMRESNFSESKKVCKMEYSILMKIVDSYFLPFHDLDQKDKTYLFESFFCLFSNSQRAYRSYEAFGQDPNDDRLVMPDGGYVRLSQLEKFYENSANVKVSPHTVASMFKDAMVFMKEAIVEHMRRIKITPTEMACIFGIFLWRDSKCACGCQECFAVSNISPTAMNTAHHTREILLKDLHVYYKYQGYADFQITQKVGNLLLLIPKLEKSAVMFKDNYQIGDLFNMIETDNCCKKLNTVNL